MSVLGVLQKANWIEGNEVMCDFHDDGAIIVQPVGRFCSSGGATSEWNFDILTRGRFFNVALGMSEHTFIIHTV